MSVLRLGLSNRGAGASVTPSSEHADWPAVNVRQPERPLLVWRTTDVTEQTLVVDFGGTTSVSLVALLWANVVTATLQWNPTDSWGAPAFDSGALALGVNPWNGRWCLAYAPPAPRTERFLRLVLPAQTPVDGAAYFALGGLWAGEGVAPPRGIRWGDARGIVQPRRVIEGEAGGLRQTLRLGPQHALWEGERLALVDAAEPGVGDELAAWLAIDRAIHDAGDRALVWMQDASAAHVAVMHVTLEDWTIEDPASRGRIALVESVGP